jgi:hypothetical protein
VDVTSRLTELDGLLVPLVQLVVLLVGALLFSRPVTDGLEVPVVLLVVAFAAFPVGAVAVPLPEPEAFAAALCVSVVEGRAACTISASV